VIPREILADVPYYTSGPGFWLEVLMNEKILTGGYKIENITFPWVITPRKSVKMWYIRGTIADWQMNIDIFSVMPIWKLARQFWYFSRFSAR
jgi:hypothetical protein